MIRRLKLMLIVAAVELVMALLLAASALAQGRDAQQGGESIGEQLGGLIQGIAGPIVFSLGGLTALGAFMRRDVGIGFTAMVITVILGLFVTDAGQDALRAVAEMLGNALDVNGNGGGGNGGGRPRPN